MFLFITSFLKGGFKNNLEEISKSNNGIKGGAIGVQSLLYLADKISYYDFFDYMNNDEITVSPAGTEKVLLVAEDRTEE